MAPPSDLGPRRRLIRLVTGREARFLVVGGLNFLIGLLIFWALHATLTDTPYLVVLLLTYMIGVVIGFTSQRLLVFRVTGTVLADLVRYTGVQVMGLVLNAAMLALLVEVGGMPAPAAQVVALAVLTVVLYLGHSLVSFRRPKEST